MGKSTRPVYDFLMSIDYGLCWGPLDSINQLWIKDRRVWCGRVIGRTDVDIDQPSAFGGDSAEGGVVGISEVYMGTDDQEASEALANRVGRTVETMPGYKRLAHIFFRGQGASGFRWSSNNPYLPPVEAHVTRLPADPSPAYRAIYPEGAVYTGDPGDYATLTRADGSPLKFRLLDPQEPLVAAPIEYNTNPQGLYLGGPFYEWTWFDPRREGEPQIYADGTVVSFLSSTPLGSDFVKDFDLLDLGFTEAELDAGGIQFSLTVHAEALVGGGSVILTAGSLAADENGDPYWDYYGNSTWDAQVEQQSLGLTVLSSGPNEVDLFIAGTLTPGARFLRVQYVDNGVGVRADLALDIPPVHCEPDQGGLRGMPNANPANMVYECLTNREWGMGESPALIDVDSFRAAAKTLYDEKFGLAMKWVRQDSLEAFIAEILDHIQGFLFVDPVSGLWTLRLLRNDYDPAGLPVLDPSNCLATNRKRRAWGETINEIVVTYTDPETEEEVSVAAHDLANITTQGGVISETRNYYGIRDEALAKKVADRDVTAASYPLFTAQIECGREFASVRPGDVLKLTWPEDGIAEMIVRVMQVDYGSALDRRVRLDVTEDIFSVERTEYVAPQGSLWETDRAPPVPLEEQHALTVPFPALLRYFGLELGDALLYGWSDHVYFLTKYPSSPPPNSLEVHSHVTLRNGSSQVERIATIGVNRSAPLPFGLSPEVETLMPPSFLEQLFPGNLVPGLLFQIGTTDEESEVLMLDYYDEVSGWWNVWRGCWDTIPREWAGGTRAWNLDFYNSDPTNRFAGETVDYWLLPRTTEGLLFRDLATPLQFLISRRSRAEFRPANCALDGVMFGEVDYSGDPSPPATVTASWSTRNFRYEDVVLRKWTDPPTGEPPPENATALYICHLDGTPETIISVGSIEPAISSYDITLAEFGEALIGFVEFRYGDRETGSIQAHRINYKLQEFGYGLGYGVYYGR